MTWSVFLQIFVLALLGPVIDQNFYYAGLKFTGPTFACAMSNILPAMTFVMAVIFRMEKVDLKKVRCQAKVAGTLVTVAGAMMMTLYKGPLMKMAWSSHVQAHGHGAEAPVAAIDPSGREWFLGSLFVIIATLAWASLFILQAHTLKHYAAPLSLTTLICFVGTLQAIVVTFAMEHRPSVWTIGFDMNLLAAAYAGIVTSSIAYYVQGLVIQKTGPVFASAFSPLMMIIVAVMGSFILSEKIFLGGVLGAVLIVMGLYSVLWGKHKEAQEKEEEEAMELPVASSKTIGIYDDATFIKEIAAAAAVGDDSECKKANGVKSSSDGHGAGAV
jgi:drug/metabolite transporter (DMT)-like permease